MTPHCSTRRSRSSRSADRIVAIGFLPIHEKTSSSKRLMIFFEWSPPSSARSSRSTRGDSLERMDGIAVLRALTCLRRRLAQLVRIEVVPHLLSRLLGLLAGEAQRRVGMGAEADRLAASVERVVEPPAVRAAFESSRRWSPLPSFKRVGPSPALIDLIVAFPVTRSKRNFSGYWPRLLQCDLRSAATSWGV